MKVALILLDNETKEFDVSKNPFTLGRSKSNDVSIPHEGLSRVHCQIELNAQGEIVVTDLDSTNGVFIQGNRIKANEPTVYPPFLSIIIGPIIGLSIQANEDSVKAHVPYKMKEETKKTILKSRGTRNEKKTGQPQKDLKKFLKPLLIIIAVLTTLYIVGHFNESAKDQFELPSSPKDLNI